MRILIAEDDPFSLSILSLMLESERCYEIVPARDGGEAWAELGRGARFDLCIFDIMMPELDGLKLVERMRADPRFRDQSVIFCTALNERSIITQAAALGVSHYIVKPYFKEHVLKQVRRICEEGSAAAHIEPTAQVAARLGVDQARVRQFLHDLHGNIATLITAFQADARAAAAASLLRVNSLKGAALNLGARTLGAQLAALEDCCAGRVKNGFQPALVALEAENQRLRRMLGPEPVPVAPVPAAETKPVEAEAKVPAAAAS